VLYLINGAEKKIANDYFKRKKLGVDEQPVSNHLIQFILHSE
jgi:hypothetical protein